MKIVLVAFTLAVLSGCTQNGEDVTENTISICIGGVQYWQLGAGQSRAIAPRIDPETFSFVRC